MMRKSTTAAEILLGLLLFMCPAIFQPVYLREYRATTLAPYGINSRRNVYFYLLTVVARKNCLIRKIDIVIICKASDD